MRTLEEIQAYCDQNNITLTSEQEREAVNLVDNEGYDIPSAVDEAGHPETPPTIN